MPFPSGTHYSVNGVSNISFDNDTIIIQGPAHISVLLDKYEIYTSEVYGGTQIAYPDIPVGIGFEDFVNNISNRLSLVKRLTRIPSEIHFHIHRAQRRPQPASEWPLSTILIHLWLAEDVIWQTRLRQMIEQDNPRWVWTEPNLDEAVAQQGNRPLTELAEQFAQRRQQTIDHLKGLSEAGWARIGTHATYGEMDVAGLCARILEHDEEHLTELRNRAQTLKS